jgi:hypothetical protein
MLKIFESTIDDVLEQHRGFYVADVEHGWRLDCDHATLVHELREALRRERSANKALRRAMGLSNNEGKELASRELRRDAHVQASHSDELGDAQIRCDAVGNIGLARTLGVSLLSTASNLQTDVLCELGELPGTPGGRLVG